MIIVCNARFQDGKDLSEVVPNYEHQWKWDRFAFDISKVVCFNPCEDEQGTSIYFMDGQSWIVDILFDELVQLCQESAKRQLNG